MKHEEWKTYRTRFLVNAKQLTSSLSFVDHLGRQHCGRKGDYLVESSDGVISIAPRRIFEDIYVPMPESVNAGVGIGPIPERSLMPGLEPMEIENIGLLPGSSVQRSSRSLSAANQHRCIHRKFPQSERRSSSTRLGLM